ncbi:MAG TPA: hypothetical protein VHV77_01740 [Pirellulales bacterium]|jgi:hypothetical protein|nr:hypothetical protein [Pirellulales bacterium]
MQSRIVFSLLGAAFGYTVGVFVGILAVNALSTNLQDRTLEVASTAAFVVGPIAALVGLIVGALLPTVGRR